MHGPCKRHGHPLRLRPRPGMYLRQKPHAAAAATLVSECVTHIPSTAARTRRPLRARRTPRLRAGGAELLRVAPLPRLRPAARRRGSRTPGCPGSRTRSQHAHGGERGARAVRAARARARAHARAARDTRSALDASAAGEVNRAAEVKLVQSSYSASPGAGRDRSHQCPLCKLSQSPLKYVLHLGVSLRHGGVASWV